jgi:hypothetical protein
LSVRTLARLFPSAARRTTAARFARWGLQRLEDRVTPAELNVWTGVAGDGLWSSPNNWHLFHVPDNTEDAIINLPGAAVTHGSGTDEVHGLQVVAAATLTLSGGTIATPTLDVPDGHFDLAGGTLAGATVTAGSTVTAGATSPGGVLSGVTLRGTLDLTTPGAHANVAGGLTLDGGTVLVGDSNSNFGVLSFDGAQTLGGTGTVVFGTSPSNILHAGPTAGSHLTIGPNVLVRGAAGTVGFSDAFPGSPDVTVQGTIQADVAGGTITLDGINWTNAGTVRAQDGGTVRGTGTTTNFAAGTLTGGSWQAVNGTLRILGGNVTTNAAAIVLDGPGSAIYSDDGTADALGNLVANAAGGTFTLRNGRTLTTAGALTNAGFVSVGVGSALTVAVGSGYTQTGGVTTVDGTLSATAPVDIRGGLLEGKGGHRRRDQRRRGRPRPGARHPDRHRQLHPDPGRHPGDRGRRDRGRPVRSAGRRRGRGPGRRAVRRRRQRLLRRRR